ncbi:unnamed protein product [Ixodes pacificus]
MTSRSEDVNIRLLSVNKHQIRHMEAPKNKTRYTLSIQKQLPHRVLWGITQVTTKQHSLNTMLHKTEKKGEVHNMKRIALCSSRFFPVLQLILLKESCTNWPISSF